MAAHTFEQEWLSGHEHTHFPFAEIPDAAPEPMPHGFLNDLRLFLSGYDEVTVYISEVSYAESTDTYTLSFSLKSSGSVVLSGSITRTSSGAARVGHKQLLTSGRKVVLFTPGSLWDTPSWGGAGDWTKAFTNLDALIEPTQVIPGPQTLRRIFIDGETIPPVDEWPSDVKSNLVAGYNLAWGSGQSRVPVIAPVAGLFENMADLSCGPGLGEGFPPLPAPAPLDYVARINGIAVSSGGAITLQGLDCLRVSQPENNENEPVPNTLQINSDCIACCPCSEYRKMSRALGRRSAKIRDTCDIVAQALQESATIYNDAVARINDKRPPLAVIRNIQTGGDQLRFTVSNVCELPLFVYVAINIVSSAASIGRVVIADGQPFVSEVDQTGASTIYPVVDDHRLTLPPLPFDLTENPTATFPTANFSNELGEVLMCVGMKTDTAPFSPIEPGSTVLVTLSFPDVSDAITAAVGAGATPEEVLTLTVGGRLPVIKFRSVAVYGASHCYPCAAETYIARTEYDTIETDITTTICGVQIRDRFRTVVVQVT